MKDTFKLLFTATAIAITIIVIQLIGGWLIYVTFQGDWSKSGPFGDSFAVINTLFSGFAFGGVIIALIIQAKEIRESKKMQNENVKLALLTARINAAISKQEIFADFLVNGKQFPGRENENFGRLRSELKFIMDSTDKLVQIAEKELMTEN